MPPGSQPLDMLRAALAKATAGSGSPKPVVNPLCSHILLCEPPHIATNIELNETLFTKAMQLGGMRTKKEAVNEALAEYVQRPEQPKFTKMFGKVEFDTPFEYREQRQVR
jgi:Arc/MetJ family transcription regulator